MVEKISVNKIPIENYQLYCDECKFRSVSGFIKIEFDKREGIIPRSTFKFFTSPDGDNWDQVGFTRTKGEIITFVPNNSYIELGGHSDGQSFGNTFLDANVLSLEISTLENTKKIIFEKQKQNEDFFVFKPNTQEDYKANITYENNGIKLFRPNKYWVAINNEFDFTNKAQNWFGSSVFGVKFELPLTNANKLNVSSQKAKIAMDQAATNLEEQKEKTRAEVQQKLNDYQLAVQSLNVNEKNMRLSTSIEEKNSIKFFEGLVTSFELRQAQLQLLDSQQKYLNSVLEIISVKTELETLYNN